LEENRKALIVLVMNTVAFAVCFAAWVMNGVLIAFLVVKGIFDWSDVQIGTLLGIPILTGSIMRLPLGLLSDQFGGRNVFTIVMLFSSIAMVCMSFVNSYAGFIVAGLAFGFTGASFAVGVAYTSLWFDKTKQGTALGIFAFGTVGTVLTLMIAPTLLAYYTRGGNIEGWRNLPLTYAALLLAMAIIYFFCTYPKKVDHAKEQSLFKRLEPLKEIRVHRFGYYYFIVFGGFVALSQWLLIYYLSVYGLGVALSGMMATLFSLPAAGVRAFGGWLSDKIGPRKALRWSLGGSFLIGVFLAIPVMDVYTPGKGILSKTAGEVTFVSEKEIVVKGPKEERVYPVLYKNLSDWEIEKKEQKNKILPGKAEWQVPIISVGDKVGIRQPLARGVTNIYFKANVWVFSILVFLFGCAMGLGMGAVYKYVPEFYPTQVGVVGGLVGVIGGLGGFILPILFGYLLQITGLWTTCWLLFIVLNGLALWWLYSVVQREAKRNKETQ
jgi:MFS transporter, NNP family, nitrate/nitrite transporter